MTDSLPSHGWRDSMEGEVAISAAFPLAMT